MGITKNFSNPEGVWGKIFLSSMNVEHSFISKWGLRHYKWQSNTNALDIGCGGGINIKRMLKKSPMGTVCGLDISKESVEKSIKVNKKHIGKRCEIKLGSSDSIPFPDEKFDVVTAFETVYFWTDIEKSFSEVSRVLRPGGTFLIVGELFNPNSIWSKMIEGINIRTADEIKSYMKDAGFSELKIFGNGNMFSAVSGIKHKKN